MFDVAGGSRILYGYLAIKEDIDIFNRHNKGTKKKLFADFSANMASGSLTWEGRSKAELLENLTHGGCP